MFDFDYEPPYVPGSCGNCGAATSAECALNDCPESYTGGTLCTGCGHAYDKHRHDSGDASVGLPGFEWCEALGTTEEDGDEFACKCEHFTTLATVAMFGREVLAAILADRNFFDSEESEKWCELLAKFGYAERITYDPEKHGQIDNAEPGFDVWIFTDAMRAAAKVGA